MHELFEHIKWNLWKAHKALYKLQNGYDDPQLDRLEKMIREASMLNGELRRKYEVWDNK